MSLRLSEPTVARRTRTFLRRWERGSFQPFLENLGLPSGGPAALLDPKGRVLARLRGTAPVEQLSQEKIVSFGQPPVASLVGDIETLPEDFVGWLQILLETLSTCKNELDGLSDHALERHRELNLLYDFTERSTSKQTIHDLLGLVTSSAMSAVHGSGATVQITQQKGDHGTHVFSTGTVPSIDRSVVTRVREAGVPLVGMFPESLRRIQGDRWSGALVCLPLRTGGKSIGTLVVAAGEGRLLQASDERILTALATLAATRIEQARLQIEATKKHELATIGRMASSIVHDFKNPLTAIRGFAEMIAIGAVDSKDHIELAEQIVSNADRLWSMADELLHFVRGNAQSLKPEPVSGSYYARHLRTILEPAMPKSIRLHVDLEAIETLYIDEGKFDRVLVNLVRNAVEAIKGKGQVQVLGHQVEGPPEAVKITVCDDGPGIPKNAQEHLFEPFFTVGKVSGTGLGLAIVKKLVLDHGGSIEFDSHLGKGTCFTIQLGKHHGEDG